MRCRSCGMASIHDHIAIHAWHCLNCGHVKEAVSGDIMTSPRSYIWRHGQISLYLQTVYECRKSLV